MNPETQIISYNLDEVLCSELFPPQTILLIISLSLNVFLIFLNFEIFNTAILQKLDLILEKLNKENSSSSEVETTPTEVETTPDEVENYKLPVSFLKLNRNLSRPVCRHTKLTEGICGCRINYFVYKGNDIIGETCYKHISRYIEDPNVLSKFKSKKKIYLERNLKEIDEFPAGYLRNLNNRQENRRRTVP